jgi:hypothetical protein
MAQATIAGAAATATQPKESDMRYPMRWLTHAGKVRVGAAFFLAGALMPAAAAAATAAKCQPTKVTAVASDVFVATTSTTFVPLTGAGRKFIQGGSRPSCVLVRFEGYVATADNTVISISAAIDGATIAPNEVQLAYDAVVYQPRAWTFIIPKVAPGEHRIGFKFRTNNGNGVSVNRSNTIIHYAP